MSPNKTLLSVAYINRTPSLLPQKSGSRTAVQNTMRITDLPFNSFIGIAESPKEEFALTLPEDKKYTNHVGTVHASALLALAEATSGHFLMGISEKMGCEVIPLVRRLESKFRKPAVGSIHSQYNVEPEAEEKFLEQLKVKGRSILAIQVNIYDASCTHVLSATIDWFVSKK